MITQIKFDFNLKAIKTHLLIHRLKELYQEYVLHRGYPYLRQIYLVSW